MKETEKTAGAEYIRIINENFRKCKSMGDKTFDQLSDSDFHYSPDEDTNSIAVIIQHMAGNLKSRFTDFYNSDGEKPNRNRDSEFVERNLSKDELIKTWEDGWKILFAVLDSLKENDLLKNVFIRGEKHSVIKALELQITHHAYHVGQIIMMGKQIKKSDWKTLSIPKKK
jgi:uncharacterized damage-inducible protein DinB